MRRRLTILVASAALVAPDVAAVRAGEPTSPPLQLLPDPRPQKLFAGGTRTVSLIWSNTTDSAVEINVGAKLFAASSATVLPITNFPARSRKLLAHQAALDWEWVTLPPVKAETRFLIRWVAREDRLVGVTDLQVYPADVLKGLNELSGDGPVGLFDPNNITKPLLKAAGVEFSDLQAERVDAFGGRLAIVGPFETQTQVPSWLGASIKAALLRGAAVVWLQPPSSARPEPLEPSFSAWRQGGRTIIIAQEPLTQNLAGSAEAQANLLELCRRAVQATPPRLPWSQQFF